MTDGYRIFHDENIVVWAHMSGAREVNPKYPMQKFHGAGHVAKLYSLGCVKYVDSRDDKEIWGIKISI